MAFPTPLLDIHLQDHYSPYSNPDSNSGDEDENASLRSQALNADGTPKRPMNAFMIFARRRRPQVSAANQMMRTGEISKILSKEWNTMAISDKQFYLDQAKKLKENFNAKYPDYVYRRRPNNSRKKRRTDASIRGVDADLDPRDDSLSPHEHSPEYHPHLPYSLPYSDSYPYYSPAHHPHSSHAHAHAHHYPHSQTFDDDPLTAGSFPSTFPVKLELSHPNWPAPSSRRPAPLPLRTHHHHSRHWSDSTSSTGAGPSTGSGPAPSSAPPTQSAFPTLIAPFYPSSSGTVSPSTASSSSLASAPASYFASDRDFDAHSHSHGASHTYPTRPYSSTGSYGLSPATGGLWSSSSLRSSTKPHTSHTHPSPPLLHSTS